MITGVEVVTAVKCDNWGRKEKFREPPGTRLNDLMQEAGWVKMSQGDLCPECKEKTPGEKEDEPC